jgi:chemotaxis signal transduction protein
MFDFDKDDDLLELEEEQLDELSNKYLIIDISGEKYAIEIAYIKEIVQLPKVTRVPDPDISFRGVIKLREDTIPIYDLRKLLGLPSLEEEDIKLIELLKEREKDHIKWLEELVSSIEEKREFKLTTDPHACAFGKWYDNFHTDDINLSLFLTQFDIPHKRIHAIAVEVRNKIKTGDNESAMQIIEHAKESDFKILLNLFKDIDKHIQTSHRELAIIVQFDEKVKSYSADRVDEIIEILPDNIQQHELSERLPIVKGIGNAKDYTCVILNI